MRFIETKLSNRSLPIELFRPFSFLASCCENSRRHLKSTNVSGHAPKSAMGVPSHHHPVRFHAKSPLEDVIRLLVLKRKLVRSQCRRCTGAILLVWVMAVAGVVMIPRSLDGVGPGV